MLTAKTVVVTPRITRDGKSRKAPEICWILSAEPCSLATFIDSLSFPLNWLKKHSAPNVKEAMSSPLARIITAGK